MTEQQVGTHDAFLDYCFSKLFPFLRKYKVLLISLSAVLITLFAVIGISASISKKKEQKILNNIYSTLGSQKEITSEVLSKLNDDHGADKASIEVKWLLAGEFSKEKKFKEAAKIYSEISQLIPDSALTVHALLGEAACYVHEGKYSDALTVYDTCIDKYTANSDIALYSSFNKAFTLYSMKEYDKSKDIAESILNSIESMKTTSSVVLDVRKKAEFLLYKTTADKK